VNSNLGITSKTQIYIGCPAYAATGGPELLHQLTYSLKTNGLNAKMFYFPIMKNPIHPEYVKYGVDYVEQIEDIEDNILIVPETKIDIFESYKKVQKILWWQSVDNFYTKLFSKSFYGKVLKQYNKIFKILHLELIDITYPIAEYSSNYHFNLDELRDIKLHLVQSEYAKQHLLSKGFDNISYLGDYLNDDFIAIAKDQKDIKENIVVYNPKKGYRFTKKIIQKSPQFQWIAIENMKREDVIKLLQKAKVYIDFGNHPGMDRIPREAAIMGCCVIVGKRGSGSFYEDVTILDEFKYVDIDSNIEEIVKKIGNCLSVYEEEVNKFETYREKIKAQKIAFDNDVKSIFYNQKE
jgi:hypothetical protein